MVHAIFAARSGRKVHRVQNNSHNKGVPYIDRTHPQLRHRLEQVKYSSGKKQLLAATSPVISPLKRSLSACGEVAEETNLAQQRR